jgi:hypothetical protein
MAILLVRIKRIHVMSDEQLKIVLADDSDVLRDGIED